MTLGEEVPITDDETRRIEALFRWITNTGSAYHRFCGAAIEHRAASWWVQEVSFIAIQEHRLILASASCDPKDEPRFSAREVLLAASALVAHFAEHTARLADA